MSSVRPHRTHTRLSNACFLLALAIVLIVRLAFYAGDRQLWVDEAGLMLNVLPSESLFAPLDSAVQHGNPTLETVGMSIPQTAPWGFVIAMRTAARLVGVSEHALRIVPLMASLTGLAILAFFLQSHPARLPILLFYGCSGLLIEYSTELKQYGWEGTVALMLLLWFYRHPRAEQWNLFQVITSIMLGVTSVWLAFTSVFVLIGAGLVLLAPLAANRSRAFWKTLGVISLWGISFLVYFFFSLRTGASNMMTANAGSMAPPVLFSIPMAKWYIDVPLSLAIYPLGLDIRLRAFVLVLLTIGFVACFQQNRRAACIMVSPVLITFLAALVHRYPWAPRHLVFIGFPVAWLAGCGLFELWKTVEKQRIVQWAFASLMLWAFTSAAVPPLVNLRKKEGYKYELHRSLLQQLPAEEKVLLYHPSALIARFYQTTGAVNLKNARVSLADMLDSQGIETLTKEASEFGTPCWIVLGHNAPPEQQEILRAHFDESGLQIESERHAGTTVAWRIGKREPDATPP
jgi:hypothetical protein